MSGKRKIGDVELDNYHYHEATHTINVVIDMIDRQLLRHPVVKLEKESRHDIDKAVEYLYDAYQKLALKY